MRPDEQPRPYHVVGRIAERPGEVTHRVVIPGTGALAVARAIRMVPGARAELGRLTRDVAQLIDLEEPVLATYRDARTSEEQVLIVRDWVDGVALADHPAFAAGRGSDADADAARDQLVEQVAASLLDALGRVHRLGIIARRLSPTNIFLTTTGGRLVLTDVGVRLRSPRAADVHVAPEVKAGVEPDARADLFTAGSILHLLATGAIPSSASGDGSSAMSASLRRLLAALLTPDPTRRVASAERALETLALGPSLPPRRSAVYFRAPRILGCAEELATVGAAVDRLTAGIGDALFIRGAEGLGKTRLLGEAVRHAVASDITILSGGATDRSALPFGRFIPCLETIASDMQRWSAEERTDVLRADGKVLLDLCSRFHRLPEMKGLNDPPALGDDAERHRLLRVAGRAVAAYARRRRVLLVLDDLEEADALSREFTRFLAMNVVQPSAVEGGAPVPLLILASYDCPLDDRSGGRTLKAMIGALRVKNLARELTLRTLAPHEVRDLLAERLGLDSAPAGFVAKMLELTGGNPLQVEETLGWLADRDVLAADPDEWTGRWERARLDLAESSEIATEDDDAMSLLLGRSEGMPRPSKAQSGVGYRLRSLGPDGTRLLELAAIAGNEARLDVLRCATDLEEAEFTAALVALLRRGDLQETDPGLFVLRHGAVRDAVLGQLDSARRRTLHGRVGIAIEQLVGRLDGRASLFLAHHFHQAGDVERSLLYLPLAARLLEERHAAADALLLFERFFRHLQELDPGERDRHLGKRIQALFYMAETLAQLDRKLDASQVYREMASLAEQSGRDRDVVAAWSGLARMLLESSDHEAAERFARRAVDLARHRDLDGAVADNMCVIGQAALRRGRQDEALWNLTGALDIYRERGDALGVARASQAVADIYCDRFDHQRALETYRFVLERFSELDDKLGVAGALDRLGQVYLSLGDSARALAHHREALRLVREVDHREGVGHTLDLLGAAFLGRGELDRARSVFKEALSAKREVGDVRGSAESLLNLASTELQAGLLEDALRLLDQALTLARRAGNQRAEASALTQLTMARLAGGELERARDTAGDAVARARDVGDRALECRALTAFAAAHEGPRALEASQEAVRLAEQLGLGDLKMRAQAGLGRLLRTVGRSDEAVEPYTRALEAADTLMDARSGSSGFVRRGDMRQSLNDAADFLAERTGGDPAERFPFLRANRELSARQLATV